MGYGTIIIVGVLALIASILLTSVIIPVLEYKQTGQNIRQEGPQAHLSKSGTPSMGGIGIIAATVVAAAIGGHFSVDTLLIFAGFLLYALIGFIDDYLKVIKKQNEGLRAWQKFGLQLVVAVAFALYMALLSPHGTEVYIPFADIFVYFGGWYVPFIVFTILAMVNAVNLTDGLDGLAAGTTAIVCIFMAIVALMQKAGPSAGFYAALVGACIGFLVYNKYPAKVFMGDTGSLALGGGITFAAIVMKMELFLPLVGLVYVLEALSVVIQVSYFKASGGKRIFKMAPLHHHFELSGMHETKVALMLWGLTLVCCIIGLVII
ncbi:MAG: phospho-N-acetylmuramoyl-pentapeptide-transferase [Anaerovoracaceae bacterium]|jgi:phospho-N-acetylmuramoyl-pentapeptide-transferase